MQGTRRDQGAQSEHVAESDRDAQITSVLNELARRCESGDRPDTAAIEQQHPHLMPELGARLRAWQRVDAARLVADERSRESVAELPGESFSGEDFDYLRNALDGYELLERIHYGGQGVVYKAVQRTTDRIVAIKVLLHGPLATQRQQKRFSREVEFVARLRHPNIVTLYESGMVRGRPFFAMEHIDGLSIDDYALLHKPSVRDTVVLFCKIVRAVSSAHRHGIIHRDLKPLNILVDPDGEPHVLDFGLAKDLLAGDDPGDASLVSMPGQVLGTLPYLSPEQAAGRSSKVDVRSDVYALGIVLYELLTERFPYQVEGDPEAVRDAIMSSEPARPRRIPSRSRPDSGVQPGEIDDELAAIILKTLEKDRSHRYQSAAAFADDLDRWLAGEPVEAKTDRRFYLLRKTLRRYRLHVSVAAAFFVVLAASLVGVTLAWQKADQDAQTFRAGMEMGGFLRAGGVERDANRLELAEQLLQQAVKIGQGVDTTDPDVQRVHFEVLKQLAELLYNQEKPEEAKPYCDAAVELAERLVREFPGRAECRQALSKAYLLRAREAMSRDAWDQAARRYEQAAAIQEELLDADPENTQYRRNFAFRLNGRGRCLQELERFDEARECYQTAHDVFRPLVESDPEAVDDAIELSRTELKIAVLHLHQKTAEDDEAASAWLKRAEDRLIALQESGRSHGREWDIRQLSEVLAINLKLVARREQR